MTTSDPPSVRDAGGADGCYVWVWLPGATTPVVAGRLQAGRASSAREPALSFAYGRSYRDRPDADSIVHQEKAREHHLRGAGFALARYNWSDAVARPWIIPVRAAEAARHRTGPPPTCWHLDDARG